MPILGALLDLAETRLTGVNLSPPQTEPHDGWTTAALLRIDLTDLHEPRAVAGALAPFMASTCAVVYGLDDDAGTGWVAPILVAGAGLSDDEVAAGAGMELARAVTLLGIDNASATVDLAPPLTVSTAELIRLYQDRGHAVRTLRDWTVVDLIFGLVLELITDDLEQIVDDFAAQTGPDRHDQRRDVLSAYLEQWVQQHAEE